MNSTDILQTHGANLYEITFNLLSNSKLAEFIPNKTVTIIIKPDIKYINKYTILYFSSNLNYNN